MELDWTEQPGSRNESRTALEPVNAAHLGVYDDYVAPGESAEQQESESRDKKSPVIPLPGPQGALSPVHLPLLPRQHPPRDCSQKMFLMSVENTYSRTSMSGEGGRIRLKLPITE
jgi:hypothetical protein